MPRPEMQTVLRDGKIAVAADDLELSAERERRARDELDRRTRIGVGAQSCDPVGRLRRLAKRRSRQVADVKVALKLRPGPSVALIVNGDALAVERLGLQRRVRLRGAPQRRACGD